MNKKKITPIDGINAYDGEEFKNKGITELFTKINSIINKYKNDDSYRIYLNITGGYKGVVPYATLQGMLYPEKVTICYLYESSLEIIEIPKYPIGVDYHKWEKNVVRLKMIDKGEEDFKKNLAPEIENLIKNGHLDTLGKQLQDKYESESKDARLEVYSKEIINILLKDTPKDNLSYYREKLEGMITKAGVHIWTGDKIPEMVEHARRHHHNLLKFAEQFFTFDKDKKFFNINERFCLIAGILLHDCGHSLNFIKIKNEEIPLFPNEIRDFHHFLSVQRLNNDKMADDLGWIEIKKFNLNLSEAILEVCLNHRRRMPFDKDDNEKGVKYLSNERELKLEDKKEKFIDIDIMKIVAFMRIIDGCDNQVGRAGKKNEITIACNLIDKDYEILKNKAKDAFEAYKHCCILAHEGNDELKKGCIYIENDNGNIKLKKEYINFKKICLEKLKNGSDIEKTLATVWLTAAEFIDIASMRFSHKDHYIKHQCVKEVLIYHPKDSLEFDIVLYPNNEEGIADVYLNESRKKLIEKEVSDEYKEVEKYLYNTYKIKLRYWWEKEYNKFINNEKSSPFYPLK
ncbi:hypothetical protein HY745_06080 [Candidatus Desantisbacteria bacterium]|nr:hypothetical protein [Candidatus Desantisbacteria bacterium]